jgi:hypothetical protein
LPQPFHESTTKEEKKSEASASSSAASHAEKKVTASSKAEQRAALAWLVDELIPDNGSLMDRQSSVEYVRHELYMDFTDDRRTHLFCRCHQSEACRDQVARLRKHFIDRYLEVELRLVVCLQQHVSPVEVLRFLVVDIWSKSV